MGEQGAGRLTRVTGHGLNQARAARRREPAHPGAPPDRDDHGTGLMTEIDPTGPTPSARALDAFIDLVNRAAPGSIAAELERLFTPENLAREPLEARISSIMSWQARGGFEPVSRVASGGCRTEILARHPATDETWRLAVETEAAPPHRIDRLLLGRAPMPVVHSPPPDTETAEQFVSYVSGLAERGLFSGAVLIGRDGQVLRRAAFGRANRDFDIPNTADTRFNVASLTKSWTAVAVCQLVERGALDLEAPLSDFVDYPDAATAREIGIRHLLSHTSGLGDYFNARFDATPRGRLRDLDAFLDLARGDGPAFAPGTGWRYSNIGMILLGKVIEAVTGRSYHDHVTEAVLGPAGMPTAGFVELDHVNPGIAVGYHRRWTGSGPVITNSLFDWAVRGAPDGCGYATVTDIWNFAEAFRHGRLVSAEMACVMTTPKPDLSSPDYGFGFAIHPERALYGHSGGLIGASANLDITLDPQGWVIVVLANDLSMRAPVLKARQLVGVTVPEADAARAHLPRGGLSAR